MIFLGLFLVAIGAFAFFQARLPRAKRNLFGRGARKGAQPLGRYGCVGFGIFASVAGVLLSLAALGVYRVDDAYIPLVAIPLFVALIGGIFLDGISKEPNQPLQPTRPFGPRG